MRQVILLAGPGAMAFNKQDVKLEETALKKHCANVVRIGDGKENLTESHIEALLSAIDPKLDITLIIRAHGAVKEAATGHLIDESHFLILGENFFKTAKELFIQLAKKLHGRPIDIFSTACYSGDMHEPSSRLLPTGSTYTALAPATLMTCGADVDRLFEQLNLEIEFNITAENLLLLYLTSSLKNRI